MRIYKHTERENMKMSKRKKEKEEIKGRERYNERDRDKHTERRGGSGETRQSQEVKKDTAVIFTDIPPGVKVWNWKLMDWRRGEQSREVAWASLLSALS